MLNLCVNARDAMAGGGTITITAENVQEPDEDGLRGRLREAVDRGHRQRHAAEVLARVFEPFFTTKDVGKGSGLGLRRSTGSRSSPGAESRSPARSGRARL